MMYRHGSDDVLKNTGVMVVVGACCPFQCNLWLALFLACVHILACLDEGLLLEAYGRLCFC